MEVSEVVDLSRLREMIAELQVALDNPESIVERKVDSIIGKNTENPERYKKENAEMIGELRLLMRAKYLPLLAHRLKVLHLIRKATLLWE
jgi:hypothetical protein